MRKLICFLIGHQSDFQLFENKNYIFRSRCKCCKSNLGIPVWKTIPKHDNISDDEFNKNMEEIFEEERIQINEQNKIRKNKSLENKTFHEYTQTQKGRVLIIFPIMFIWLISLFLKEYIVFPLILTGLFITAVIILHYHDYLEIKKEFNER